MDIGKNIKKFRLENELTQEQLAEKLGVSMQAVSRWETSITYPDIILLPLLAEIFNCTTDELLAVDNLKKEKDIKEILSKNEKLWNEGRIKEMESLIASSLTKYPNSWELKNALLSIYFSQTWNDDHPEIEREYEEKCIELGEEILNKCTIDKVRENAKQILIFVYGHLDKLKAKKIWETLPSICITKEEMKVQVVEKDEVLKAEQEVTIHFLNHLWWDFITSSSHCKYGERTKYLLKYIEIMNILFEDDNFGFFWSCISEIYMFCAIDHAGIHNKEETYKYLKLFNDACSKYKKFEDDKKELKYNSFLISEIAVDPTKTLKSFEGTDRDRLLRLYINKKEFDFIRDEREFRELIK